MPTLDCRRKVRPSWLDRLQTSYQNCRTPREGFSFHAGKESLLWRIRAGFWTLPAFSQRKARPPGGIAAATVDVSRRKPGAVDHPRADRGEALGEPRLCRRGAGD